jgi:hypothetical protein
MGGYNVPFSYLRFLFILFGAAVLAIAVPGTSAADTSADAHSSHQQMYQYTDRNGVVAFTNDPSRIPAEYRATAKTVNLPPLLRAPDSNPQPPPESPSLVTRIRDWNARLSLRDRLLFYGILPTLVVLLSALSALRRRADNASVKFALRVGMVGIVLLSVGLGYVMFMRVQATTLTDGLTDGSDMISSVNHQANELNTRTTSFFKNSNAPINSDQESEPGP